MIIGLSGTFGAGKDSVARYLVSRGFEHCSTSDSLREFTTERGRKLERENYRLTANELEEEFGGSVLAKKCLDKRTGEDITLSGIRRMGEIKFLRNQKDKFTLLFIDAPIELRYQRMVDRSREGEGHISFEELKHREGLETSGQSSQRLDICQKEADEIVVNDGSEEALFTKIDKILEKIGWKAHK